MECDELTCIQSSQNGKEETRLTPIKLSLLNDDGNSNISIISIEKITPRLSNKRLKQIQKNKRGVENEGDEEEQEEEEEKYSIDINKEYLNNQVNNYSSFICSDDEQLNVFSAYEKSELINVINNLKIKLRELNTKFNDKHIELIELKNYIHKLETEKFKI